MLFVVATAAPPALAAALVVVVVVVVIVVVAVGAVVPVELHATDSAPIATGPCRRSMTPVCGAARCWTTTKSRFPRKVTTWQRDPFLPGRARQV